MKKTGCIDIQPGAGDRQHDPLSSSALYVFRKGAQGIELAEVHKHPASGSPAGLDETYLSLPLDMLNFRVLTLPFSDPERLRKVIPFELEGLIMGNADAIVFDATVLGSSGDSFTVLVVYADREFLRNILSRLEVQGMDPCVITSLELGDALRKGTSNISEEIMRPRELSAEDRIAAAQQELLKNSINLRVGPLAYTKHAEEVRKRVRLTVVLLLLLGLVIDFYYGFRILGERKASSAIRKEIRSAYTTLFPGDKKITDELSQMKSHLREVQERSDTLIGVSPLHLLLDLSQKMVPGVSFYEIQIERETVTLKGEAAATDAVDKVKVRLSEFLGSVSVSDIKPSAGGKTVFTVVAKARK